MKSSNRTPISPPVWMKDNGDYEGGNFIDVRFGPLTLTGNYRLQGGSPALLAGSAGLFAALAAVMWATRRVDWYATGIPRPQRAYPPV